MHSEAMLISALFVSVLACCIAVVKWIRTTDGGFLVIALCLFIAPWGLDYVGTLAANALEDVRQHGHGRFLFWKFQYDAYGSQMGADVLGVVETYKAIQMFAKELLKAAVVMLIVRAPVKWNRLTIRRSNGVESGVD